MRNDLEEEIWKNDDKLPLGESEPESLRHIHVENSSWLTSRGVEDSVTSTCVPAHIFHFPPEVVLGTMTWELLVPALVKVILV